MRLTILGSGSSQGWPGVFCGCKFCQQARTLGGKDIRTRSGALLGEKHKIDFPPDSFAQALRQNLDWSKLEHLFFTHAHSDHFYPAEIKMRRDSFNRPPEGKEDQGVLHIYGSESVYQGLTAVLPDLNEFGVVFHELKPFKAMKAGTVTAVPLLANHMAGDAFIYLFSQGDKTLLYALDTGWFPKATWDFLASGPILNCVVLDATFGLGPGGGGHMGVPEVMETKAELSRLGLLTDSSIVIASHFSPHGGLNHAQLEELLSPHGISPAYDGMVTDI